MSLTRPPLKDASLPCILIAATTLAWMHYQQTSIEYLWLVEFFPFFFFVYPNKSSNQMEICFKFVTVKLTNQSTNASCSFHGLIFQKINKAAAVPKRVGPVCTMTKSRGNPPTKQRFFFARPSLYPLLLVAATDTTRAGLRFVASKGCALIRFALEWVMQRAMLFEREKTVQEKTQMHRPFLRLRLDQLLHTHTRKQRELWAAKELMPVCQGSVRRNSGNSLSRRSRDYQMHSLPTTAPLSATSRWEIWT